MGELQLEIMVDRMKREFGVLANVGAPQVAYKETIKKEAKGKENISDSPEDADNTDTAGYELSQNQKAKDSNLSMPLKEEQFLREFISSIEKGVKETMENGILLDIRWSI